MEHTPGPWEVAGTQAGTNGWPSQGIMQEGCSARIARTISDALYISKDTALANAHLIAAAPELLEACELYQAHQTGTHGHYCGKCAKAIEVAIQKARGQ